ncbi:MAG: S9 family peptidase [Bacteroidetes bacterium]|nr:MAG: S9 family peptidase [Bacteroidota bacterium]
MILRYTQLVLGLILAQNIYGQEMKQKGPEAIKKPETLSVHGDDRIDNYFWMRLSDEQKEAMTPDAQTQQVINYLEAENDYTKKQLSHTEKLQEQLYTEITARIKQDDSSVPYTKKGYSYYSRFEKGQDYPYICRKKNDQEEILLNGPEMGEGQAYFQLSSYTISANNDIIAYGVDFVSRRQYTIFFKEISTGKIFEDKIENTSGSIVWANDNKTIFYAKNDPVTLRTYRIYKHVIGTDPAADELVYEETDDTFNCYVFKTKSDEYIMIGSHQTMSAEYRFIPADKPNAKWTVLQPRERGHEYSVDHLGDSFYIITNWDAKNFRLMKTPVKKTEKSNWKEVLPHREDVFLESIEVFNDYLVLTERSNGLNALHVRNLRTGENHYISFNDPAYVVNTSINVEINSEVLRFSYTSLTTPNSVYDYNLKTRERELLKVQEVVDPNFDPANYISERIYVVARDGAKVPVSIVYHKNTERSAATPLLLYGYGSYGYSIDPYFSSVRLSLLDRGFVFAIAHIRGGQEMGRAWYEDGKLLNKKNTFNDFIDCAKHLCDAGYTSPDHLYAQGGSAGGLLMGAVINMEPDLWNGVIAGVPFVDVISTMLDESIPLTTGEFDEWGNPKDKEYYDYIKSYSPYDNIEAKNYPNLLVTTGYWDSQVQYWEPAKWVAKLRELKTDDNILLLHCDMDVGHGGASGRFKRYKEVAMEYAFLLDLEGISE